MMKKVFALVIAAIMLCALCSCGNGGGGGGGSSSSNVQGLEVTKLPDKVDYAIGEEVSFAGGEITVTYKDGKTEAVALNGEGVSLSEVQTDKAGKKTITVTYGEERTRFDITVAPYIVDFDLGGKGSMESVEVKEVGVIDNMPADPEADGFSFDGWYYNQDLSDPFDPTASVTGSLTLYAKWMDMSSNYLTVLFDLNYYGAGKSQSLSVEENASISKPSDPERVGYSFDGWFTTPEGGEAFDFSTPVSEDTTAYAGWTLTASGTTEYVFEAEDIDLTGKKGKGYSGEQEGKGLIQTEAADSPTKASNNRFVGYTYVPNLTLDFHIVSDRDVSDATIVARMSGEFADFKLTPSMFVISLNGESINYGSIEIKDVPNGSVREFEDYVIITGAELKEGENHLSFLVNNDVNWIGGGTVAATAPVLDNVKITTSAVLWWNGEFNLPMKNY